MTHEDINRVIGQAEAGVAGIYKEEGVANVWVNGQVARGVRVFLSNLLITPGVDDMKHQGLLIKEPLLDFYKRFKKGDVNNYRNEEHVLSTADIDLLLGLARSPSFIKQKVGVGTQFTTRLRVLARDHQEALRRKKSEDLISEGDN